MQIEYTIDNAEAMDLLKQVKAKIGNMEPVMADIGETTRRSIQKTFDAGGRPAKWEKSNRVKADGGETLKLKGILKNSITVLTTKEDSVSVGTADKRARVLHAGAKKGSFGTFSHNVKSHDRKIVQVFGRVLDAPKTVTVKGHTRTVKLPWGDIPARKFMMLQDEDWVEINKSLIRFLEN